MTGKYEKRGAEIGALVDEKNAAYGSAFHKASDFLKILYPNGIAPEQYADALCVLRIFDKQMRIANRKNAFGESPYRDIAGYAFLGEDIHLDEEQEASEQEPPRQKIGDAIKRPLAEQFTALWIKEELSKNPDATTVTLPLISKPKKAKKQRNGI